MAQTRLHTIFHAMDAKGIFDQNSANVSGRDSEGRSTYSGPQPYPMMFYHPQGLERIINPGEWVETIRGPQLFGEQKEIITELAADAAAAKKLQAAGWWDHPAKAMAARPGMDPALVPPISSDSRIKDLEAQIRALEAEKERSQFPAPARGPVAKANS